MNHKDFRIGCEFHMSGKKYRCTDVGTRVVTAIQIDERGWTWFNGPPYSVAEIVIDENDMEACKSS